MANIRTVLTLTHGLEAYQTIAGKFTKSPTIPREELTAIRNFFHAAAGGDRSLKLQTQVDSGDSVFAHATVTVLSGASGDTAVVSGTTFTAVDHRETTNVTFAADSGGSLNSKFFTFQDQPGLNKYYLWFSINSVGVDPAPAGYSKSNGIKVSGATGATAATLATAAVAAAAALNSAVGTLGVTVAAGASGHIIITDNAPGVATKVTDGSAATSFTFTRSITGSTLTAVQYNVGFTDTGTAASLAAAINADAAMQWVATASSAAAVVTVSSFFPGPVGNYITLTAATGNTASAATLGSGAVPTTTSTLNTYRSGV